MTALALSTLSVPLAWAQSRLQALSEAPSAHPIPPPASQLRGAVLEQPTTTASEHQAETRETSSAFDQPKASDKLPNPGAEPASRVDPEALLHDGLDWDFCGPRPARLGSAPMTAPLAPDTPIEIDTGALAYQRDSGILTLSGGVDLRRAGERLMADRLTYDRNSGNIETQGATLLERPGLRMIGDQARLNLETSQGQMQHVSYRFSQSANLRGTADLAELLNSDQTRYSGLVYSTCPPGSNAWSIKASTLKLDQDEGIGVARDARLRIKGVPVVYTPYLRFPIDGRRRSGFLTPTVGTSDASGLELVAPYYWNIAPNLDMTLSPHFLSERGLLMGTELRYLTRHDSGRIEAEFIPDDAKYAGNGARWALNLEENGTWLGRFSTLLEFSAVSDDSYLEDFGNGLDITSTRQLLQRGTVSYFSDGWSLQTALQGYQTVDPEITPEQRPYGRLPQVIFNLSPVEVGAGLIASVNAEYDYFDHNHIVYGQRLAMQPSLSLPLRRSYGHLIPRLSLNLSGYDLSNAALGQPTSPSHSIPTVEVDGKLVFERDADWFGTDALQTLEPRLYYLYTPYEDQSATPVFDSADLTFTFSNLFRSNRFTGRDRIGDANQVTTALSSRFLNAGTGEEMLRLSVGRILYFADRRVQVVGPTEVADESPITGEVAAQLFDRWRGRASLEWDPAEETDQWGRRTLQLQYREPNAERLVNLAYRFDRGTSIDNRFETTDLSFRMPVSNAVNVVGRWLYSLETEETNDAFAGIEFGQCCWKIRLLGRHSKNRTDSPANTSVMLQVELAGLGAFGSSVDSFLQREVYGYPVD
ncbi:MAG: LPS assembly protein LptD [Lamprobacter sp.]|uniref:LPS assembly protein LptD n=1 Tax=Lamprobacter sp. TaxID=3100796 RepID=UPI002B262A47|nr:LPS assembly protein LptD [Lamprobacter sp.]MEA3640349.1 LPS assembly protein LptD [Lamprobacter sp.]